MEAAASVLLKGLILGIAFLLLWFGIYHFAGEFGLKVHGALFGIGAYEFALVNYCGMGLFKILVIALFLIPYVAIRWALKTREPTETAPPTQ